jgi:hypothetical protein
MTVQCPRTALYSLIFIVSLIFVVPAYAQQDMVGSIDIEDAGKQSNPYDAVQDEAIALFEKFLASSSAIAAGNVPELPLLSSGAAQYLAAVNLFCTLRYGSCPTLLQALYEIEVARSVSQSRAACPDLNALWKNWVDADMERRVDLDLKIGFVKIYDEFKSGGRRKYIRCSASIEELMTAIDDRSAFFATRFAADGSAMEDIRKTVGFLNSIRAEIPNIFSRLGMQR